MKRVNYDPRFLTEHLHGWCCQDLTLREVTTGVDAGDRSEFKFGYMNSQMSLRHPSGDVRQTAGFTSLGAERSPETGELLLLSPLP